MARRATGTVVEADPKAAAARAVVSAAEAKRSLGKKPGTALERRHEDRIVQLGTMSKKMEAFDKVLIAAAMVMDPDNAPSGGWPAPNSVTRTWQHAAWGYVRSVPELNAAMMFFGNCLSRCKLVAGKRNPDGSVEQGFDGDEPAEKEGESQEDAALRGVVAEAADIISQLVTPRGGQSEILRAFGEKVFVAGECYMVPQDLPTGFVAEILSTQELIQEGKTYARFYGPGWGQEELPVGTKPIRLWRQDGQYQMLATSSVRSCLEVLEELVVLTRLVRAAAISRMSLAGVLVIPDELDTPDSEGDADGSQSEAQNSLAVDMINTGAKAIDDPASAAAWMPYILQGPSEYIQHVRHIPFQTDDQENVIKRAEAVERLARGLDLPPEKVLGHMSCVDTATEILTSRGWRSCYDLFVGDEVLTLNHETGLSEWQIVDDISTFGVSEFSMVSLEGQSHSSLSTGNHRWPVITQRGKRRWRDAADLNTNCRVIPAAPPGDLPTEAKHADALVELVAWYFTEGTDAEAGGALIYQSERANPHHVANIRRALTALAGPAPGTMYAASRASVPAWREVPSDERGMVRFRLNKPLAEQLRDLAPEKVPTFDFLRSLTAAQLELFIQRAIDADGWSRANGEGVQFHQADVRRTDAMEFALILSGRAVHEGVHKSSGGFAATESARVISRRPTPHRVGYGVRKTDANYTGIVWCPSVENGTWLARRNGTVYFTGNTTYANAGQISEDNFNLYIEPCLQMLCDALTLTYLWPMLCKNRSIDAEHLLNTPVPDEVKQVAVTFDARRLISKPDRSKDILEVYIHDVTFMAVKVAEAREAMGLDPATPPDDTEVAKRIDAYRLGKIREVIQAPSQDAAVPIDEATKGNAPVPGESAGARLAGASAAETALLPGATASTEVREQELAASAVMALDPLRLLAVKIAGTAELTIDRALEKLASRVRNKKNGLTTSERARIDGVHNSSVARILGPEVVARVLGPHDDPTLAEVATFTKRVAAWARQAECDDDTKVAGEATAIVTTLLRRAIFDEPLEVTADLFADAIFGIRVDA